MPNTAWSRSRFASLAVAGAAVVLMAQCKKSPTEPVQVAAANLVVPADANAVKAIEGVTFSFPNGGAALTPVLANQTFTLTFSNTASATPTATFVVPGLNGNFAARTTFGSCIFEITSSTVAGVTVGQRITVNPCQYNVATGGVQATGQATTVNILLQLGIVPSAANQASVSINPNGTVTVNNTNVGTITLRPATP